MPLLEEPKSASVALDKTRPILKIPTQTTALLCAESEFLMGQKLKMYSIKDTRTQSFGTPFCQVTDAQAERTTHAMVKDPQSIMNKNPEDFQLYRMGQFCTDEGTVTFEEPTHLHNLSNLVNLQ